MQGFLKRNIYQRVIPLLVVVIFCCFFIPLAVKAYQPRVFLWALDGSERLGRLDVYFPFWISPESPLLYLDTQGETDTEMTWYTGVGGGFRKFINNNLYGAYAFVDRNFSIRHHAYYDISPGVEMIAPVWEARVNGYFPVGKHKFTELENPLFVDTCGRNINCDLFVFQGHQQFVPIFRQVEEVGPGVDLEVGRHLGWKYNGSVFLGGYYYRFDEAKDVTGLEARAVFPVSRSIALTVEATYDNVQRGALVGGIRLQGGHLPHVPFNIEDHLYDPVARHLGSLKQGTGLPIAETRKFDHLRLVRDNIYFFSETGQAIFSGVSTGTYENPLAVNQFTQATVDGIDAIAANASLFFNSGHYVINPVSPLAPNAFINLPGGQSIHGRTNNFQCSAVADERPMFLGELILAEGNNTLDSIRLVNSLNTSAIVGDAEIIALSIENAANVSICNSIIQAAISAGESPTAGNVVTIGIRANNSSVVIDTTQISSAINISGSLDNGTASAIGIGNFNANAAGNSFSIFDSEILASSRVAGFALSNASVGIGTIAAPEPLSATSNFASNNFILTNTRVLSTARVALGFQLAFSAGIGSIAGAGTGVTADFIGNTFTLNRSQVDSAAIATVSFAASSGIGTIADVLANARFNSNVFTITDTLINSNALAALTIADNLSFSAGIGGNANLGGNASFLNNRFLIQNSEINSSASSLSNTPGALVISLATAIGGNAARDQANSDFNGGQVTITNSILNATSTVFLADAVNFAVVIGGNAGPDASATFGSTAHNQFRIELSELNSAAIKASDNGPPVPLSALNFATGIGGNSADTPFVDGIFQNTTMDIFTSQLNVLAQVSGANSSSNIAVGLFAGSGTVIRFNSSTGLVEAVVGSNTGTNSAFATLEAGGVIVLNDSVIVTSP